MKNGCACLFLWESILFAHLTSFSLFGKRPFRELTVFIENLQKVSSSASVFACKSSQVLHGWVGGKTRKQQKQGSSGGIQSGHTIKSCDFFLNPIQQMQQILILYHPILLLFTFI